MKAFWSALTAAVLAVLSVAPTGTVFAAENAAEPILSGDITCDGVVDSVDLTTLQAYLLGNLPLSELAQRNADISGDGFVDGIDLTLLRQFLMKESPAVDYTGLVINEACTSNHGCFLDSSGNMPDWLELYNATDHDIDLSGCGLSDGKKNLYKFTFPSGAMLAAGAYCIVICDDTNVTEGEFHAPFKLSADGETVRLSNPDAELIDMVAIPALETDTTYGRYANGSDSFSVLTPTPGASNDTGTVLVDVAEPVFSVEGGFYDAAFQLTIDGGENVVYYTTDGSDPTTSDTARIYNAAISIYDNTSSANVYSAISDITTGSYTPPSQKVDKGIVIRAAVQDADGNFSDVVTNSYFVGKSASYYRDMKVVSLVTDSDNLFDSTDGIYVNGDGYHEWLNSSSYVEYEEGDVRNPTNYNQEGRDWERPAAVQVFEGGTLAYTTDIGVRIAGNWSRAYAQKSLRFYARSDYGDSKMEYEWIDGLTDVNGNIITSYDKITLRNGGTDCHNLHFRDEFMQGLVADRAVDIQGTESCILFIDGEFWGLYTITEKLEDEYIESHYGIDKDNVTTVKCGEVEGSQEVANAYTAFLKWAVQADMTDEANYQKVCDTIDIQSFMDYIAIETYINNADWSTAASGYMNNWQMWRANTVDVNNPYADGKWRFMLYDTEFAAGLFQSSVTSYGYDLLGSMYQVQDTWNFSLLFYQLLDNETFLNEFYANYIEIMENNFDPNLVDARITEYDQQLKTAFTATNQRFGCTWINDQYDSELTMLRTFFQKRPGYAKQYLNMLTGVIKESLGENMLPSVTKMGHYAANGGNATFQADATSNTFTANVTTLGVNAWDIQAQFSNLTLQEGKIYRLTFDACCTNSGKMDLGFTHLVGTQYLGFGYSAVNLTPTLQHYSLNIAVTEQTYSDWLLFFNFGSNAGTYTLQNISLSEVRFVGENMISDAENWFYYCASGDGSLTVNDSTNLTMATTALPNETWEMQAVYGGMQLEAGKTYEVSYTMQSSAAYQICVHVQQNFGDYTSYARDIQTATAAAKTYTVTFTATEDCENASLCFDGGYNTGTVSITDISLTCVG